MNDPLLTPATTAAHAPAPTRTKAEGGRRFICRGCYDVYSEDARLPAEGIPPGTTCQQLPENWRCPDCGPDKGKLRPYVA